MNNDFNDDITLIQDTLQCLLHSLGKLKTAKGVYVTRRLIDLAGNMKSLVDIEEG